MPISNDDELQLAVKQAGKLLQDIQNYVGERNPSEAAAVSFPSGFIRTVNTHKSRLPFITEESLKKNISYTLLLSDVYLWLLLRTNLKGIAEQMVIKAGLFLAGAVCESITKHVLHGIVGNKKNFKERTTRLRDDGYISSELKDDLDWVWDMRNNQHLFLVSDVEFDRYEATDYARAGQAVRGLIEALQARSPNLAPP